jgi:DNA-binding protein YbaB
MLETMKQMQQMRRIQKQLAAKTVSISSNDGLVTVVARGDMTVESIKLKPEALTTLKLEKLERVLASTVNGAMDSAKKAAAADMAKMAGGLGGLSEMFGGG